MSLPVHLVPGLAATEVGAEVLVDGSEGHHAVVVRRLRVGEQVVLTDGAGTCVTGEIVATTKRDMTVHAQGVTLTEAPTPSIVVVQAIPKGDRGELAVEVLTEIGVARIVPWAASRSVVVWKGERAEKYHARWSSTAREAAKQARRSWFPTVDPVATTAEVVELIRSADVAVVLHEEASQSLSSVALPGEGHYVVVVGPEGGLTSTEVEAFKDAGASVVLLGPEVLRTSTAGLAACAALLSRTPRWG